jgi:hypothetical protein
MNNSREYEQALDFALSMLKRKDDVTDESIRSTVELAIKMLALTDDAKSIDVEALVWELQSRFNVRIGTGTILESKDRREWLPERRDGIEWRFWKRYERYLLEEENWSPRIIRRVDELTDKILERLENPCHGGNWDRRGMVAGQVQSGKTANYTGLVCKAADAGYRLIIVLAGMHNDLRSQTQLRLDEGFLGYNTRHRMTFDQNNHRIGVGTLKGEKFHPVQSLTHSDENGDFKLTIAKHSSIDLSSLPLLLVVKKNGSILRNLNRWLTGRYGEKSLQASRVVIPDIPLLLIDDECDNASINTRDEDANPTTINARIRELLYSFTQSSYVGYTATPFANIFINLNSTTEQHGDELFPRDFIVNLPAPDNYIGPVRFFGLNADPDSGLEAQDNLPVVRYIEDYADWIADAHKKDYIPGALPFSLIKALKSFIISCAARIARGQEKEHNSMLVHVTRFTEVQNKVKTQISRELQQLQRRLRYGDGQSSEQLYLELERLWIDDFLPTSEAIDDPETPKVNWQEVKDCLETAAKKIEVRAINGKAKELLDYIDNPDGLNVIAIGGDKLSRGLTLSGLTVSYYLRASKMYDTLMQMGRWFGYRPKYLDLCRLYTTKELVRWYEHITIASEELRQEFDYMAMLDKTPAEFGLKVRTHPTGLTISSVGKIREGKTLQVSYAGSISETVAFYKDPERNQKNFEKFAQFLSDCGEPTTIPTASSGDAYIWTNIPGIDFVRFLKSVETHSDSLRANSKLLADYISAQLAKDELRKWTIALKSKRVHKADEILKYAYISGYRVGLYERKESTASSIDRYSIKRLVSPSDESIDIPEETKRRIREELRQDSASRDQAVDSEPSNPFRKERSPDNGLFLIYPLDPKDAGWSSEPPILGFAISFPGSKNASSVEYRVNNVYYAEEFGDENDK